MKPYEIPDIPHENDEYANELQKPEEMKGFFGRHEIKEVPDEIRERLEKCGIRNLEIGEVKGIWQKRICETMESMTEKYPELKGYVGSIVTRDLPHGVYACTGPKMMENGYTAEVQLDRKKFSGSALEWKIVGMESENFAGERWLAGRGLNGVLTHELGHAMHLRLLSEREGLAPGDKDEELFGKVQEAYGRNAITSSICWDALKETGISAKDVGRELSLYGSTDFGECFAEAISEVETQKKPRPYAQAIQRKYEELVNREVRA